MEQELRRRELYSLMEDLPARDRPIRVLQREIRPTEKYVLEKVVLDLNGIENVPAYFVKPTGAKGKLPTILYNHWHGGQYQKGKDGLILASAKAPPKPYAEVFTEMGYAALCIDHWAFGERSTRSEGDIFKDMLWHGRVMWGMMVYDSLRAIDYLISREDVDSDRLGTLGMSMGSTMAWWVAALDERVKVCVDICCLTDFDALMEANNLSGHGVYYFIPGLVKHFSAAEINALIVPRAHLGLAGNLDTLTPPRGLDRIDAALRKAYAEVGAPERWKLVREDVGHQETESMRREIVAFLGKWM